MLLSTIFYSIMALLVRIITKQLHSSQVVLFRFMGTFIFISALIITKKIKLKAINKKGLILRGIFGGAAISLFFASISLIPLGRATLLTYMYPIPATILAHFFLNEKIRKGVIFSLITAILGLVIITGFDITKFLLGDILGILSAIFSGIAVTYIRKLRETDSSWSILYSLGFFGSILISPIAISNFILPTINLWVILLAMAILSIIGQLLMTYSYKFCKASTGSIISLTTVVLANLWGIIFLKEILSLNFIIGGLLVLGSTIYIVISKPRKQLRPLA